jgi:hypothetical protein
MTASSAEPQRSRRFRISLLGLMCCVLVAGSLPYVVIKLPIWCERFKHYQVNKPVLTRLDREMSIDLRESGTLDDALAAIRDATDDREMPTGIPIYINPVGLLEASRSLSSPIHVKADKRPIREVLAAILDPLGLDYQVKERLVIIDSRESIDEGIDSFR